MVDNHEEEAFNIFKSSLIDLIGNYDDNENEMLN